MKPYRCWHHITELEENHSEALLIALRYKHPEKASARSTLSTNETPNRQTTGERDNAELIIVQFEEADELNLQNWPFGRKLRTTLFVPGAGLVGGWASANDSTITTQAQAFFGVSAVTESLSTGLYLVAFGVGSLVSGPFSETVAGTPSTSRPLSCS